MVWVAAPLAPVAPSARCIHRRCGCKGLYDLKSRRCLLAGNVSGRSWLIVAKSANLGPKSETPDSLRPTNVLACYMKCPSSPSGPRARRCNGSTLALAAANSLRCTDASVSSFSRTMAGHQPSLDHSAVARYTGDMYLINRVWHQFTACPRFNGPGPHPCPRSQH